MKGKGGYTEGLEGRKTIVIIIDNIVCHVQSSVLSRMSALVMIPLTPINLSIPNLVTFIKLLRFHFQ